MTNICCVRVCVDRWQKNHLFTDVQIRKCAVSNVSTHHLSWISVSFFSVRHSLHELRHHFSRSQHTLTMTYRNKYCLYHAYNYSECKMWVSELNRLPKCWHLCQIIDLKNGDYRLICIFYSNAVLMSKNNDRFTW